MSATFTDFLREKAENRKAELSNRQAVLDEWRTAVQRLLDTIKVWLRTSDPDGILKLEDNEWEISEEGLGTYKVPRLDIHGLGSWVGIVPKARYTVGTVHPPQKSAPERAAGR